MKRKKLSRDAWRFTKSRYEQIRVDDDTLHGVCGLIRIDESARADAWQLDKPVYVNASGMYWLSWAPDDRNFVATAMFSPEGEINLWYIDLVAATGFDEHGVLWFDDLYLDLIARGETILIVDDRDELDDALASGDITRAQYDMALTEADRLARGELADRKAFEKQTRALLARFRARPVAEGIFQAEE